LNSDTLMVRNRVPGGTGSGTTPAQLTVSAVSINLPEGVYRGEIAIIGPDNTTTVPVQLTVPASNIFTVWPVPVTFSVHPGLSPPPAATVLVYGGSTGVAISASTSSGGPWLSVDTTTDSSGQLIAVIAANPAGLTAGTYNGTVKATSPAAPLPATLPVTLVIWDNEPTLTVTPPTATFILPLDRSAYQQAQFVLLQVSFPWRSTELHRRRRACIA
jgi:hypothetical protein